MGNRLYSVYFLILSEAIDSLIISYVSNIKHNEV